MKDKLAHTAIPKFRPTIKEVEDAIVQIELKCAEYPTSHSMQNMYMREALLKLWDTAYAKGQEDDRV